MDENGEFCQGATDGLKPSKKGLWAAICETVRGDCVYYNFEIRYAHREGSFKTSYWRFTPHNYTQNKLVQISGSKQLGKIGDGDDRIIAFGTRNAVINAKGGADLLYAALPGVIINANMGSGNDIAIGGRKNDTIDGGDDNDYINGNAGNDCLLGGEGCDSIDGSFGNDILTGGSCNDYFVFSRREYNGKSIYTDTITDFTRNRHEQDQIVLLDFTRDMISIVKNSAGKVTVNLYENTARTLFLGSIVTNWTDIQALKKDSDAFYFGPSDPSRL